ncbi:MAG: RHS repeat-associated core domain-containing protein [Marinagarivorans sp.]|nr:RHS repeat-associated core domain-containing protein [Marinagarivorans sp.]
MINADASIDFKRTIGGVAQVTHRVASNGALGAGDYKYLHKDHLGSITAITYGGGTQKGQVFQRMAFDPWGARREISNNKVSAKLLPQTSVLATFAKTAKPITNRGFTGHEMLDEVGIIHMNGRIYDATIGRFLQADPIIQDPTAVGSLNRYSYVWNNPMNATDPSGYIKILRKAIKSLSKIFGSEVVNFFGTILFSYLGGPLGTALWSYEFARANGISPKDAMKGAAISYVSGAAFGAIGRSNFNLATKAVMHGIVGGTASVLQGGKFGHGFVSAGVAKLANVNGMYGTQQGIGHTIARVAMAAIIGGTVSEATGGKFANGARMAAMAQLFNGEGEARRAEVAHKKS